MTQKSCIKHPEKTPLVILRSEYLSITNNHCAAKLLSIFEYWSNKLLEKASKLNQDAREWIYKSYDDLYQELMGEHGVHSIRKAIRLLIDLGYLSQRHNPWHKHDRKYQYHLEIDNIQESLDSLYSETSDNEQMQESEENEPSVNDDSSIAQNGAMIYKDNNLDYKSNIESENPEFLELNKESIIKKIADALKIPISQASINLSFWCSWWRNDLSSHCDISDKLEKIGLSPQIFDVLLYT